MISRFCVQPQYIIFYIAFYFLHFQPYRIINEILWKLWYQWNNQLLTIIQYVDGKTLSKANQANTWLSRIKSDKYFHVVSWCWFHIALFIVYGHYRTQNNETINWTDYKPHSVLNESLNTKSNTDVLSKISLGCGILKILSGQ